MKKAYILLSLLSALPLIGAQAIIVQDSSLLRELGLAAAKPLVGLTATTVGGYVVFKAISRWGMPAAFSNFLSTYTKDTDAIKETVNQTAATTETIQETSQETLDLLKALQAATAKSGKKIQAQLNAIDTSIKSSRAEFIDTLFKTYQEIQVIKKDVKENLQTTKAVATEVSSLKEEINDLRSDIQMLRGSIISAAYKISNHKQASLLSYQSSHVANMLDANKFIPPSKKQYASQGPSSGILSLRFTQTSLIQKQSTNATPASQIIFTKNTHDDLNKIVMPHSSYSYSNRLENPFN